MSYPFFETINNDLMEDHMKNIKNTLHFHFDNEDLPLEHYAGILSYVLKLKAKHNDSKKFITIYGVNRAIQYMKDGDYTSLLFKFGRPQ